MYYEDLAIKLKERHPEYANTDNRELVDRYLKAKPQYRNKVTFERQTPASKATGIKDSNMTPYMRIANDPTLSKEEKAKRINAYGAKEQAQYTPENARREYAQQKQVEISRRKEAHPFAYGMNAMFNPVAAANDYYLQKMAENGQVTGSDYLKMGAMGGLTGAGDVLSFTGLGGAAKLAQGARVAKATDLAVKARNAGNIARATQLETMAGNIGKADTLGTMWNGAKAFAAPVGAEQYGQVIAGNQDFGTATKNTAIAGIEGAALGALSKAAQPALSKITKQINPMERVKADLIKQGKEPSKELIDKYIEEHPYLYGLYQTTENTAKGLGTTAIDTAALANMDYGLNTLEGTQQQSYGEHLKNYAPFLAMGGIPAAVGLSKIGARAVGSTKTVQGAKQAIGNFIDEHPITYNTLGTFNNVMNLKSPKNSKIQAASELENALQWVREENPNITTEELRAIEEYFANNPEASKEALIDLMGKRKTDLNEGTTTPEENNFAQANKELLKDDAEKRTYNTYEDFLENEQATNNVNKEKPTEEINSKFEQLKQEALEEQYKREQEAKVQPETQQEVTPSTKEQQVQEMTEQVIGKKKRGRPKNSKNKPKEISQPVESDLRPVKNKTDVNTPKQDLTTVKSQSDMSGKTNYVPNEKAKPIVETKETKAKAKQEKTTNVNTTEAPVRPKNKTVEGSVKKANSKKVNYIKEVNNDYSNNYYSQEKHIKGAKILPEQDITTANEISKKKTSDNNNIFENIQNESYNARQKAMKELLGDVADKYILGENGNIYYREGRGKVEGKEILALREKIKDRYNKLSSEAKEKFKQETGYDWDKAKLEDIEKYKEKYEVDEEDINNSTDRENNIADILDYENLTEEQAEAIKRDLEYTNEVGKGNEEKSGYTSVTQDEDFIRFFDGLKGKSVKEIKISINNFTKNMTERQKKKFTEDIMKQLAHDEDKAMPREVGETTETLDLAKRFSDDTYKALTELNKETGFLDNIIEREPKETPALNELQKKYRNHVFSSVFSARFWGRVTSKKVKTGKTVREKTTEEKFEDAVSYNINQGSTREYQQNKYNELYDKVVELKTTPEMKANIIGKMNDVVSKNKYIKDIETKTYDYKKEQRNAINKLKDLNALGDDLTVLRKAADVINDNGLRFVKEARQACIEHWELSVGKRLENIDKYLEQGNWRAAEKELETYGKLIKTDISIGFNEERTLQDIFEVKNTDKYIENRKTGTTVVNDIESSTQAASRIAYEKLVDRIQNKIDRLKNKNVKVSDDVTKFFSGVKDGFNPGTAGKYLTNLKELNRNIKREITKLKSKGLSTERLSKISDDIKSYMKEMSGKNSEIYVDEAINERVPIRIDNNKNFIHINPQNFKLEHLSRALEEHKNPARSERGFKLTIEPEAKPKYLDELTTKDKDKTHLVKDYIDDVMQGHTDSAEVKDFVNKYLSDLNFGFEEMESNVQGKYYGKGKIKINSNLKGDALREAIKHETHHAIWEKLGEILGEDSDIYKAWQDRVNLAKETHIYEKIYPEISNDAKQIFSLYRKGLKNLTKEEQEFLYDIVNKKVTDIDGKTEVRYFDKIKDYNDYESKYLDHEVENGAFNIRNNGFTFLDKDLKHYGQKYAEQFKNFDGKSNKGNRGIGSKNVDSRTERTSSNDGQKLLSERRQRGLYEGASLESKNVVKATKEAFDNFFNKFKKQEEAITPDKFKIKSFLSDFFPKARKQITELEQDKIKLLGVPEELIENRKKQLNAEYYMPNATKHVNKQNGIDITKDQSQRKEKAGLFGTAKSGSITNSENALYDSYKELVTQMTRMKFIKDVDNTLKKLGKYVEDSENLSISAGEGVRPGDKRNGYIAVNEVLLNNAMWNKFSPEYVEAINNNAFQHIPKSSEQISYLNNLYEKTRKADYWIPEHIYNKVLDGSGETIREYIERYTEGKLNGRALKKVGSEALNIANDFFKRRVLGTASFFVNNRLGNQLMIAANSKNPKEYAESVLNAFKLKPKEVPPEILENSIAEAFEGATSRRIYTGYTKVDNFINLLKGVDIDVTKIKPGAKRNLAKAANIGIALPNKLYNSVADGILNLNTKFENFERKQLFAQQVERTRRDLIKSTGRKMVTTQEAIKHINETPELRETIIRSIQDVLGDYSKFSKFERKYLKAAIPFYSWYRTITRHTIQLARKNPARFGVIALQLKKMADDDSDLKPYQRGLGAFRIPLKDARSGKQLVSNKSRQIPWNTFGEIAEPNGKYSMVSPAIRVPIEAAKGSKFFNNSEITNDRYLRIEEYNSNKKAKPTYKYYDIRTGKYLDKLPIAPRAGYITKEVTRDLNPLIFNSTTNLEALAGGVANKFNINMPWDKKQRAEAGNFVDTDKSYDASLGGFNNGDIIGKKWTKRNGYKDITRYAGNNVTQTVKYINRFGTSLGNKTELNKAEREAQEKEKIKRQQEKMKNKRKKAS